MSKDKQKGKAFEMPKQAPLTMEAVETIANEIDMMEEYDLDDHFKIEFYPIFSGRKIRELLEELRIDVIYAEENAINIFSDDNFFLGYASFLAIKHFTSLKDGIKNTLEKKIVQFEYLENTGYYDQILEEVFSQKELNKVYDALGKLFAMDKLLSDVQEMTQSNLEELQNRNRETIDKLQAEVSSNKLSH